MTQEFLQDAIVEDLKQLFSHYTLTNSLGVERAVKIVPQGLPIREGDDEETDAEAPPEPYVAVKLSDGEVTAQDARQTVNVVMVICVCDPDPNRQGYRDALHIVNEIVRHYISTHAPLAGRDSKSVQITMHIFAITDKFQMLLHRMPPVRAFCSFLMQENHADFGCEPPK